MFIGEFYKKKVSLKPKTKDNCPVSDLSFIFTTSIYCLNETDGRNYKGPFLPEVPTSTTRDSITSTKVYFFLLSRLCSIKK